MSQENHEFKYEKKRLADTRNYIDLILEATEESEKGYQENIKEAFEELDWVDSSLSYINILTNAKFLEMNTREFRHLAAVKDKPYFARMDFQRDDQDQPEPYYIGKTSLYNKETQEPIIVDWRSPIANIYYEGRLGDVAYEVEGKTYSGNLQLKRQFNIHDGALMNYRDIDITTRDDLLQESLSENSSSRLTEIVATIQAEQNRVIRADMARPLIVQGVAGSGKTTIALHRISYYIYQYAEQFSPDQLMVLAPSRLFIDYISDVLPELGVDDIIQTTFTDFALKALGKKYKLTHTQKKLNGIIESQDESSADTIKRFSEFKGSLVFKEIVQNYVRSIENDFLIDEHFTVGSFILYKSHKIQRLFKEEYIYLPLIKRLRKIKEVLKNQLKTKRKNVLNNIENQYDDKIDNIRYKISDIDERRRRIVKLMDTKDKQLEQFKQDEKYAVKNYMNLFETKKLIDYYKDLVTNPELMYENADTNIDFEFLKDLAADAKSIFASNKVELEDLAPMLFLQYEIFGLNEDFDIRHIVIDEAQDYSPFQFFVLSHILRTDLFTILGDLTQGIYSFRAIKDWETVQNEILPRSNYEVLKQSYRTTIEIMDFANELIDMSDLSETIKGEPVVRHGPLPEFQLTKTYKDLALTLEQKLKALKQEKHTTFAVIGKTREECQKIKKAIDKNSRVNSVILNEDQELDASSIAIVPSALAKGLEFDVVFIANLSESYTLGEMNIKLYYVAITRALHHLYLLGSSESHLLLDKINNKKFNA